MALCARRSVIGSNAVLATAARIVVFQDISDLESRSGTGSNVREVAVVSRRRDGR